MLSVCFIVPLNMFIRLGPSLLDACLSDFCHYAVMKQFVKFNIVLVLHDLTYHCTLHHYYFFPMMPSNLHGLLLEESVFNK